MKIKLSLWYVCVVAMITLFVLAGIPLIIILASRSNGIVGAALLTITLVLMAVALVAFHPEIGLWSKQENEADGK